MQEYDAIVMGAGPCGIGAASTFLKGGVQRVAVLEARDRVGGRVFTNEYGLDEGAMWIHMNSPGNKMLKRAQDYGEDVMNKYEVTNWVTTSLDGVVGPDSVEDEDDEAAEMALKDSLKILESAKVGETWDYTMKPKLDEYKKKFTPVRWRIFQNLLNDKIFDDGGRLDQLGSRAVLV